MQMTDPREVARQLMQRHGLRAGAVAQERAEECRAQGDQEGFVNWTRIHDVIPELRRGEARTQH
jgi:hypothetical protein